MYKLPVITENKNKERRKRTLIIDSCVMGIIHIGYLTNGLKELKETTFFYLKNRRNFAITDWYLLPTVFIIS